MMPAMHTDQPDLRALTLLTAIRAETLALHRVDKANRAFWFYGQHGPAYCPIMIEWADDARRVIDSLDVY